MDLVDMQAAMFAEDEYLSKGLPSVLRGPEQAKTTYGMLRQNKNYYGRSASRQKGHAPGRFAQSRDSGAGQAVSAKNQEAAMAERGGKIGVQSGATERMNNTREKRLRLLARNKYEANKKPMW